MHTDLEEMMNVKFIKYLQFSEILLSESEVTSMAQTDDLKKQHDKETSDLEHKHVDEHAKMEHDHIKDQHQK